MPSEFDAMDARAAAVITRHLGSSSLYGGQGISWLPQKQPQRQIEDRYTSAAEVPDPNRPVVMDIEAIVTWRPQMVTAGATDPQAGLQRGQLEDFDCVVDIEVARFIDANGVLNAPIEGDVFQLADEYEGNSRVQVVRDGDDGSQRVLYWCRLPA